MLLTKCLPSQWTFSNKQGTNKGGGNKIKHEMASVKQQAFALRISGVHSLLERGVNLFDDRYYQELGITW